MSIENFEAEDFADDQLDRDLDGVEDQQSLEEAADANRPYTEVTAQDLGSQDMVDDGADPAAASVSDDEQVAHRAAGVVPIDESITVDDQTTSESIEDRIQQEVPDPASDIVPPDAGRRY
ncbi:MULTISPECIES: hypothetical protein [unclassified Luteococcus]|uniref:hypothetical protein n=1 Tax=unclassified Luteococcus TaxID=2639923 RepID=UPI00313F0EC9